MKKKNIKDFRGAINLKLDENLIGLNAGKMAYNFAFSSGSLKGDCPFQALNCRYFGSLGVPDSLFTSEMSLQDGVITYYEKFDESTGNRLDKLIFIDKFYNVYYMNLYDEEHKFVSLNLQFNSKPVTFCYNHYGEDCIIFCSKSDNMVLWDGVNSPEYIIDAPSIVSCAVHKERCFAVVENEPYTLWFSDDLDPTNWNVGLLDAGFIKMMDGRGKLLKVLSFGGYLYIFRERGISRLTASGAQEDFYLTHLFTSSGKILEDSITVCGDRIIFVATDGVYAFDGSTTNRILENLGDLFNKETTAIGSYFDGKYYLATKIKFFDDKYADSNYKNNLLFAFDVESGEFELYRGLDVQSMTPLVTGEFNSLVVLTSDNLMCTTDSADTFYSGFMSGLYHFEDIKKPKTVRKISAFVKGTDKVEVVLYNEDGDTKSYILYAGTNDVNCVFSGRAIGFKVFSKNYAVISGLTLEVA